MKLNKQNLFDKLDKLYQRGCGAFTIEHTSQAVRVEFLRSGEEKPAFELIMTTRVIPLRDARKESNRRESVAKEAAKYRRWLLEWKDNEAQPPAIL